MSKQDRQGVRTATELEQKYNFGKTFAEVMGIATDARTKAEAAEEKLNGNMTNEEIYNFLTNNGVNQGLFRWEDGELFINAEFIKVVDALFANNINMTGTFTHKASVFLEPGQEEIDKIQAHLLSNGLTIPLMEIPLYDFNNDGVVTVADLAAARMAMLGVQSLSGWSNAKQSEITLTIDLKNPEKAVRMTGTNMWGREVDVYLGINSTIQNRWTEQTRLVTGTEVVTLSGGKADLFTVSQISQLFQDRYGAGISDKYNIGVSVTNGDANAIGGSLVTTQWQDDTLQVIESGGNSGAFRVNYAFTAYF